MLVKNFIKSNNNREIAFVRSFYDGKLKKLPGVVFLSGFRSDMEGTKALALEKFFISEKRDFLRFDYSGHGTSSGNFSDLCLSDWLEDSIAVIEQLTEGPQILVGSSMGGWISLLLAEKIPQRIKGIVGIATAPDFTEDGFWRNFSINQRKELNEIGYVDLPTAYDNEPYRITKKLIEDGRKHLIFGKKKLYDFPVRLLQGTNDADVKIEVPLKLLEEISCPDLRLTLVKGADHSFSSKNCLEIITDSIAAVSK